MVAVLRNCIVALCFTTCLALATAEELRGTAVAITDGDTITVLDEAKVQHKIRLEGIDAPEKKQAFGSKSSEALGDKVFRKAVRVEWKSKDRYGRILGHIHVSDRWINKEMVAEGWAWHFKRYSSDKVLAEAEKQARTSSAGLWHDKEPTPPWEFRAKANSPAR